MGHEKAVAPRDERRLAGGLALRIEPRSDHAAAVSHGRASVDIPRSLANLRGLTKQPARGRADAGEVPGLPGLHMRTDLDAGELRQFLGQAVKREQLPAGGEIGG